MNISHFRIQNVKYASQDLQSIDKKLPLAISNSSTNFFNCYFLNGFSWNRRFRPLILFPFYLLLMMICIFSQSTHLHKNDVMSQYHYEWHSVILQRECSYKKQPSIHDSCLFKVIYLLKIQLLFSCICCN